MRISRELKTGIAALIIIILFITGFNYMKGINLFKSAGISYFVRYDNTQGLTPASLVTINGNKVGRVLAINFDENLKPVVEFTVNKDYGLSVNSVAKVNPELMNGTNIVLIPSKEGAKANSGDYLKAAANKGMFEEVTGMLNPLQTELSAVLIKADSMLGNLNQLLSNENRNSISTALDNVKSITSNFNEASSSFKNMLETNENSINITMKNAENASSNVNKLTEELAAIDIETNMKKLESSLNSLHEMMENMNQGNGTIGKLMKDEAMYTNLTNASKEMEELLREMKLHPKRFVHFSLFGKKDKGYNEEK